MPRKTALSAPPPVVNGDGSADAPMEIVDGDDADMENKPVVEGAAGPGQVPQQQPAPQPRYPGGYPIDVCFEASKLPLDVAIFNSARAAGGDDKIRKYLTAVLVIGGCALIPGMAHALESRCGDRCERTSYVLPVCSPAALTGSRPSRRPSYPTWRRSSLSRRRKMSTPGCSCGRAPLCSAKWTECQTCGSQRRTGCVSISPRLGSHC